MLLSPLRYINPVSGNRGSSNGFNPLNYNPYNIWDSENATIVGTTTTWLDYNNVGVKYNLVNPTPDNQPTLVSGDVDFNGIDSFSFDGINDFVNNGSVIDYRASDSSGSFYFVFRTGADVTTTQVIFNAKKPSVSTEYFLISLSSGKISCSIRSSLSTIANVLTTTTTTLLPNTNYVLRFTSIDTAYQIELNGIDQAFNVSGVSGTSGFNDGKWFSEIGGLLDTIVIGSQSLVGFEFPFNGKITFAGYYPVLSESDNASLFGNLI